MMDILILGLILIIVGVGSTYIYDRYKNTTTAKLKEYLTQKPKPKTKQVQQPSIKETKEKIKRIKSEIQKQQKTIKKPPVVKSQQVPSSVEEQLRQLFDSMNIE